MIDLERKISFLFYIRYKSLGLWRCVEEISSCRWPQRKAVICERDKLEDLVRSKGSLHTTTSQDNNGIFLWLLSFFFISQLWDVDMRGLENASKRFAQTTLEHYTIIQTFLYDVVYIHLIVFLLIFLEHDNGVDIRSIFTKHEEGYSRKKTRVIDQWSKRNTYSKLY